jgi:hypothetical protein
MAKLIPETSVRSGVAVVLLALAALCVVGQAPGPPTDARGVIRLRVRVKKGDSTKGLARKRFFLIKGSLAENKSLIEALDQQPVVSRDCYYQGIGASPALITWLKDNDCESVYCREVEQKDIEGTGAVPEFQRAVATGEKQFGSRELARKWLSVNLPDELRSGYYKRQEKELERLVKQAEDLSKAKVISVMTDRNGTAYFTDLTPGTYVISNILSTEVGNNGVLWNCELKVKPGDLATETPFLISNNKDRNVKCVGVVKPLPTCPLPKQTPSLTRTQAKESQ